MAAAGSTPRASAVPKRKKKAARRAKPGERAAALVLADAERGDLIAGADEAGRGCLAGPLVAAAVLIEPVRLMELLEFDESKKKLPPRMPGGLERLDDSKRVPKELRPTVAAAVLEQAVHVAVVVRSAATVDREGLHRSNVAMLGEALDRVLVPGAIGLTDGFAAPLADGALSERVIGGDRSSAAIAAASIIAKTVRDQLMRGAAHQRWPEHGFDEHVGYATPTHHNAIRSAGITSIHRRSFASVAYQDVLDFG
ncbi:MAG: ribonuclease HII [Solirubrobacteraceae bacterium]|nr:ribonuclease HII [Solirubrobacteraceae bacterium]